MNKKSLAILLRARMRPSNSTKLALAPLTVSALHFIFKIQTNFGSKIVF